MSIVPLVPVDSSILCSYDAKGKTGGPRSELLPLLKHGRAGKAVEEAAKALKALSDAVLAEGGDLRVTELHRDVAVQTRARQKYDNWVAAGRPSSGSSRYNSATMKSSFVALPGRSMHNAGRAIDIHISELKFPGISGSQQLDKLWDIAKPLGWTPVIASPNEGQSESWHFDFWGELAPLRNRMGYEQAARIGATLVGHGDMSSYEALLQALLLRAGALIGPIDGIVGPKTLGAVSSLLGLLAPDAKARVAARDTTLLDKLITLPAK